MINSTPAAAAAARLACDESSSTPGSRRGLKGSAAARLGRPIDPPPELYQIVVECTDEAQQRDLYQRLLREGLKLRLLVL